MKQTIKNKLDKNDFYNAKDNYRKGYQSVENNKAFKYKENNELVKIFLDSKAKGNYKRIMYDVNKPDSTLIKDIFVLKKVEQFFDKPFKNLTQTDIDNLQNSLNNNKEILTNKTRQPISFATRQDIVKKLKQFWRFYRLYMKEEKNKEISDITEFLKLKKPINYNQKIEFITFEELKKIVDSLREPQMKACLMVSFELGGRVIETLSIKKSNCSFDKETKSWSIILPQLKGKSEHKQRISLDLSNRYFDLWIKSKEFKNDDFIFQYTYDYFRKFLKIRGQKVLGRHITPKTFRKSCTMHLIKLSAPEQYIKAHMGWSAGSDVINHYVQQSAIKKPNELHKKLQTEANPDMESELLQTKQQLKAQEFKIKELSGISEALLEAVGKLQDTKLAEDSGRKLVKDILKALRNQND